MNIRQVLESWFERWQITDAPLVDSWIASMKIQPFARDEIVVATGADSPHYYFVVEGLVRLFYLTPEGKERNKAFYRNGQVTGAISAAITNSTAPFTIQALEPSVLIRADFKLLLAHARQYPAVSRMYTELLSEAFIRNEQREAMLLTCNAEQRYLWLLEHEPEMVQRLPQFHIASYLGVDAVSLSRLKRKLSAQSAADDQASP